ncbi:MAG: T9SS type A sorting domain-containing protein [Bacteroidia bacterium]
MKRLLLILSFLFSGFLSKAQFFLPVDTIPVTVNGSLLRNAWAGGINFPNIGQIDLNGDGRKDLLLYDRANSRISTFLNNGNTDADQAWDYAPQYRNSFPPIVDWVILYDYNCDGYEDLFTISQNSASAMTVYRNDYLLNGMLSWTMVKEKLDEAFASIRQDVYVYSVSLPAFSDIDNDGDMDILGYVNASPGKLAYHKNYSVEDYGVCDSLDFKYESSCWGNFSLLIGGTNQVGCFHCPCRTAGPTEDNGTEIYTPVTDDQSLAAQPDDTVSGITIIDIDGDGDKDLLVGDIASENSLLIVNDGTPAQAEMGSQDTLFPSYDQSAYFNGFHCHYNYDLDNDGVKDLLVNSSEFENKKGMWFYKNVGTNANPLFEFREENFLQNSMIELGESATPVLIDYDGDGLLDIVTGYNSYINSNGSSKLSLAFFKNTGTSVSPSFELVDDDIGTISQFNYLNSIAPTFSDLDGDGDIDLLLGRGDGIMDYFTNSAGSGNVPSLSFASSKYMRIDIGNVATPQLFDADKDGLKDLIIGSQTGKMYFFHNNGSASLAHFDSIPTYSQFGCIDLQNGPITDGFASPFFYDSLGTTLLAIAGADGYIYRYDSIDGNLSGCFRLQGLVYPYSESNRIRLNLFVSGGDLNSDGKTDLIVGHATGGMQMFYQSVSGISVPEESVLPSMLAYPNPAKNSFKVKFYNLSDKNCVLTLTDMNGRVVLKKSVHESEVEIPVADYAQGIYMLRMITGKRVMNCRLEVLR